jgi:hypothetical protein
MKKYLTILLLIMACGCSLLKRTSKTSDESYNSIDTQTDNHQTSSNLRQKSGQEFVFQQDTTNEHYTIRLWPKGTFNFSPDGRFSGELDSIVMNGKQNKVSSSTRILNSSEKEKVQTSTRNRQSGEIKSGTKTVEKVALPDTKLILIIFCIIGLAIFFTIKGQFFSKKSGF